MEDVNLSFLLYFVDVKPPLEVKEHLERALRFSMRMEEADVPLDERQNSFEGDLFGMSVLLRFAYDWPEGKVYRFTGAANKHVYSITGEDLFIDAHVARLLDSAGFKDVMSREAFVAFCDEKGR